MIIATVLYKVCISDGAIAGLVTVFARLEGEGLGSWTCFLVARGMKGFSVGRRERKLGIAVEPESGDG